MSTTHSRAEKVGILIADDHALFRQGLRKLLEEERSFRVVGEAADGAEAVQCVQELKPDVLLLDVSMPRYPGLEVLRELETSAARVRTVVLAASIEKSQIVEALEHGARGVVMKECASDVLMESIRTVMAGHYWIGREKVFDILRALRELQAALRVFVGHRGTRFGHRPAVFRQFRIERASNGASPGELRRQDSQYRESNSLPAVRLLAGRHGEATEGCCLDQFNSDCRRGHPFALLDPVDV